MHFYILVSIQIILVQSIRFEQPVAEKVWSKPCKKNQHVLNDCNWCWCGSNYRFQCKARVCEEVDMFGHFKDTIQELDVGMEGHGSWRSRPTSCTPGVRYERGQVHCICDEDGNWPNPICRDLFRILHDVEVPEKDESTLQTCSPRKLYLVGCNACFCPASGKMDRTLCTNRTCSDGDPVLESKDVDDLKKEKRDENSKESITVLNTERQDDEEIEGKFKAIEEEFGFTETEQNELADSALRTRRNVTVFASCNPKKRYVMGRDNCECRDNNMLICRYQGENVKLANKPDRIITPKSTLCSDKEGKIIKYGCNICKCKKNSQDIMFCTTKICIIQNKKMSHLIKELPKLRSAVEAPLDDLDCIPGTSYKRDCNRCYCMIVNKQKVFSCTLKDCRHNKKLNQVNDCVLNTSYKTDCLTCSCDMINGEKHEICVIDSNCWSPMSKERQEIESEVEIVPLQQPIREICPKGHSYKVGCNLCVCLSNGNALCTTSDCAGKPDLLS